MTALPENPMIHLYIVAGPHDGKVIQIDKRSSRISLPLYREPTVKFAGKDDDIIWVEDDITEYHVLKVRKGVHLEYWGIPTSLSTWEGLVAAWTHWGDSRPGLNMSARTPLHLCILEWIQGAVGSRDVVSRMNKHSGYEMLLTEHFLGKSVCYSVHILLPELLHYRGDAEKTGILLSHKFIEGARRLHHMIYDMAEKEKAEKPENSGVSVYDR